MRKIPSLFKRDYEGTRLVLPEVVPGCEWVLAGEGIATVKVDGTACLVRDGRLFKRYDAKKGKTPPAGWEPCESAADPNTGHWPGWLPVSDGPDDRWHREAWDACGGDLVEGTYELVGPKVNGGAEGVPVHTLVRHGNLLLPDAPRDFAALKAFLGTTILRAGESTFRHVEGIVWWRRLQDPDCDKAKIKRRDFGLPWPV